MTSKALVPRNGVQAGATAPVLERVLLSGDLAKLTPEDRVDYYRRVCDSLGLNPFTRPFEYIVLNNRLTLYARKDATDQLRDINKVSIYKLETQQDGELFEATAYARTAAGREDIDMGATSVAGLKGDALLNSKLKAITKAKRRVTLSICGLGWLDETEIETVPSAKVVAVNPEESAPVQAEQPPDLDALCREYNDLCEALGLTEQQRKEALQKAYQVPSPELLDAANLRDVLARLSKRLERKRQI
ncbi:MAG: hypothetical protein WCL39_02795 [Armatimonadota bacterium]